MASEAEKLEAQASAEARKVFDREYAAWLAAGYDEDEANIFAQESAGDAYDAFLLKAGA